VVTVGLASDGLGGRRLNSLSDGEGSEPENGGEVSDLHFVWLSASKKERKKERVRCDRKDVTKRV
jgi:hypothetical protein